jgi:predicted ABC-class ATPase
MSDARAVSVAGGEATVVSLADRARQMADELGISMIVGVWSCASGWFAAADTVLLIRDFKVENVTAEAKRGIGVARSVPPYDFQALAERSRWVVPSSIDPSWGRFDMHVGAKSVRELTFGRSTIALDAVGQLADESQTSTIGLILNYGKMRYLDEDRPMRELLDLIDRDLSTEGLECLTREMRGDLARPRRYEIAAAVNRLRSLRIARGTGG